jgi:GNAT superfamily N-acetyltransferase
VIHDDVGRHLAVAGCGGTLADEHLNHGWRAFNAACYPRFRDGLAAGAAAMTGLRVQTVKVYRPYPDEAPWELLALAGADEDALRAAVGLDQTRVAKHDGRVIGAYAVRAVDAVRYELLALAVADAYRRQGLGHWLLGHAIGLAESRGAREVVVPTCPSGLAAAAARLLTGAGFAPDGDGWLLALTPE